jgi:hypothetical protein
MKTPKIDSNDLKKFFKKTKIATLDELKRVLGTDVAVTVFRKLKEQRYRTSYSHRGKYYTLDGVAQFNEQGLWSNQLVWFSKYGNLLDTIVTFVNRSTAGHYAEELESALHVIVNQPLLTLLERKSIVREKVSGLYLYCSVDSAVRKQQISIREGLNREDGLRAFGQEMIADELKAGIVLFFCLLNEQQKRLYAGLESMKLGHGGDQKIAELLGMDVHTVSTGRKQILNQDVLLDRVRSEGAGRPAVEKKLRKSSKKSKS